MTERPPWESDPALFSAGRSFDVNWLIGDAIDEAECVVYEVHEQDAHSRFAAPDPVYVGITRDFAARWGEHKAQSWWFYRMTPYVVLASGYPTRSDALKVEALLIDEHRPIFNRKVERTHLRMAREAPPADALFIAELAVRDRTERQVTLAHSEHQAGVLALG